MISAMSGQWLDGPEAAYWYDSLRAPVEFARAVRVLAESGHRVFVEVSPHPVLTAAITETVEITESAPRTPRGGERAPAPGPGGPGPVPGPPGRGGPAPPRGGLGPPGGGGAGGWTCRPTRS